MTHPFESFWEKKQKYFKPKLDRILFKSTLLRVGKKKKSVKAYLYILSNEGILSYYKNVILYFNNISRNKIHSPKDIYT